MSFGYLESDHLPSTVPEWVVVGRCSNFLRALYARKTIDGIAIRFEHFAIGSGGVEPWNPSKALAVDPTAFSLIRPTGFVKPIFKFEEPNPKSFAAVCYLEKNEAVGTHISEIGILATIVNSSHAEEVGLQFLAAAAHFPSKPKNSSMEMMFRVTFQL